MDVDTLSTPSRQLKELLGRALLDDELRARLLADPGAVARELDLAPAEARALTRLDHAAFEQRAARLRQV
ncbi:Os1348 family NHLP clan protein [Bradyrhizobium mercantei]|uniref:Os1348 family NHLP clan protein n=1 Tax=Bradyrhizobium mercantei TaxID=1904807 RepID=UPI0011784BE5|nr:Os1348 family NHLP clan protein [Bradyrhizobium mercantei]